MNTKIGTIIKGDPLFDSLGVAKSKWERQIGGTIVRFTGWFLWLFIFVMHIVSNDPDIANARVAQWLSIYFVYQLVLLAFDVFLNNLYETALFRMARIQFTVVFGTTLIWLTGGLSSSFWFVYLWPIFATAIYFQKRWATFFVFCESALGYFLALVAAGGSLQVFSLAVLLVNVSVMLVISVTLLLLMERIQMYQVAEAKLEQSESLQKVQKEIDSAIDRQQVFDIILQQTVNLVNARDGSLMVMEKDELCFAARAGRSATIGKTERRLKLGEGIAGQAAQTGKPYLCRETQTDGKFIKIQGGFDIRSMVTVPIISHGIVLGVINVDADEPNRFSWVDVQLLLNLATQTATAIERAQLLHILRQISEKALGNSEDLNDYIVDSVRRLTHCSVAMWQTDKKDKTQFRIYAHSGLRKEYADARLLGPDSIVGTVVKLAKPDSVLDIRSDERVTSATKSEAALQGWQSILIVPLLASPEQAVGALSIYGCEKRAFTPWEITLLQTFAGQAGTALQNSRRLDALKLFGKVSSEIKTQLDVDATLKSIIQGAMELTNTDSGVVHLVDDTGRSVLRSVELPKDFGHPAPRLDNERGLTRAIIDRGELLVIPDVAEDVRVNQRVIENKVRSLVGVPLRLKNKIIGALYLNALQPHQFTKEDQSLLLTLADQAAIATDNARLHEERGRRLKQFEILSSIYEKIINVGIESVDKILDLLYGQMTQVMDLSNSQVQFAFYNEAKDEVSFPLAMEQEGGKVIDVVRGGKRGSEYRNLGGEEDVKQFRPRARGERFGLNEYIIHTGKPLLFTERFEQQATSLSVEDPVKDVMHVTVWPTFGRHERPTQSLLRCVKLKGVAFWSTIGEAW